MPVTCRTVLAGVSVDVQVHTRTPIAAPVSQYRNSFEKQVVLLLQSMRSAFTWSKMALKLQKAFTHFSCCDFLFFV